MKSIDEIYSFLEEFPCHKFVFDVEKDMVMSSNDIPFCKTIRQMNYVKHLHMKRKQFLVSIGKDAAESFIGDPMTRVFIVVDVRNHTNKKFDAENLQLTEKHILDGLVDGGVLEDDNSDIVLGTLFRKGEKSYKKNHYRVTIRIYDLS